MDADMTRNTRERRLHGVGMVLCVGIAVIAAYLAFAAPGGEFRAYLPILLLLLCPLLHLFGHHSRQHGDHRHTPGGPGPAS